LRPVVSSDADRMADFFAALTEQEIYYFFSLDEDEARRLALDAARDPTYRLIAVDNTRAGELVLGYAFLQWHEESVPVFGIGLRGEAQSLGLGRALLRHLLSSAAVSGVGRVRLTVHPDNGRALRLYQRAGFRLVAERINTHQGVKQYRMEADLQATPPAILEGLTIVPLGGMGVGMAAARVQQAILEQIGALPLILDRPAQPNGLTIFVADLTVTAAVPGQAGEDSRRHGESGDAWIVSLDDSSVLVAGVGTAAVERATHRYVELIRAYDGAGPDAAIMARIPIAGIAVPGV